MSEEQKYALELVEANLIEAEALYAQGKLPIALESDSPEFDYNSGLGLNYVLSAQGVVIDGLDQLSQVQLPDGTVSKVVKTWKDWETFRRKITLENGMELDVDTEVEKAREAKKNQQP